LSVSVRVKVGSNGNEPGRVREIVTWAHDHCPLCDVTKRAVPIELEIEIEID
jgi:organic hydroperoxide reductase OsmC/OhrA